MKRYALITLPAFFACLLLTSCETTTDYGYYMSAFNDESIIELFDLSDEAIAQRDFAVYSGLFAPNFLAVDNSSGSYAATGRADYLSLVDSLFKTAKHLEVNTMIMDIEYIEPGRKALVKIQEEEKRDHLGNTQHFTSLLDVEVGFEDGWIFFEKTTRTAMQVIDE